MISIGLAMAVYDAIMSFRIERNIVWRARTTINKILYLWVRYMLIVVMVVMVRVAMSNVSTLSSRRICPNTAHLLRRRVDV